MHIRQHHHNPGRGLFLVLSVDHSEAQIQLHFRSGCCRGAVAENFLMVVYGFDSLTVHSMKTQLMQYSDAEKMQIMQKKCRLCSDTEMQMLARLLVAVCNLD